MAEDRVDPTQAQNKETAAKLGYRQLDEKEIELIAQSRAIGDQCRELLERAKASPADPCWLAMAQTDLQVGFMKFVRAIAKPEVFF